MSTTNRSTIMPFVAYLQGGTEPEPSLVLQLWSRIRTDPDFAEEVSVCCRYLCPELENSDVTAEPLVDEATVHEAASGVGIDRVRKCVAAQLEVLRLRAIAAATSGAQAAAVTEPVVLDDPAARKARANLFGMLRDAAQNGFRWCQIKESKVDEYLEQATAFCFEVLRGAVPDAMGGEATDTGAPRSRRCTLSVDSGLKGMKLSIEAGDSEIVIREIPTGISSKYIAIADLASGVFLNRRATRAVASGQESREVRFEAPAELGAELIVVDIRQARDLYGDLLLAPDTSQEQRVLAARVLGEMGGVGYRDLVAAARSERADARAAAAIGLVAELGRAESIGEAGEDARYVACEEAFLGLLGEPSLDVRLAAVRSLRLLPLRALSDSVRNRLLELWGDSDDEVRGTVKEVLDRR